MNQDKINLTANRFLGKQLNDYQTSYNPDLLTPVERKLNREDYKITDDDFVGYDIWHNYECSFMTNSGYPLTLVGKIKIPSNSKYFIESKSMKLYFFSFHMEKLGDTKDEAIKKYKEIVIKDLSEKTESNVEFEVFDKSDNFDVFKDYIEIEKVVDVDKLKFDSFKETPDLIQKGGYGFYKLRFNNVRSNCRVTHQPDFANFFIQIEGDLPTPESLLQYIVSFRNEFHFHEEVTEQVFKILKEKIQPKELSVCALFTRRGGIDICPCRATSLNLIDSRMIDVNILQNATIYQ